MNTQHLRILTIKYCPDFRIVSGCSTNCVKRKRRLQPDPRKSQNHKNMFADESKRTESDPLLSSLITQLGKIPGDMGSD